MAAVIMSVVVVVETVALITIATLWLVSRSRARHLRGRVRQLEAEPGALVRRTRRLVPRPDEAVKAVWETATMLREHGVGGAVRTSVNDLAGWAQVERPDLVRFAGEDGRVAVLFSDIEGSTSKNDELGDRAWVRVLTVHDRVVRREVERHDGKVVKTQGDGFMVVFSSPQAATRCAVGAQRTLEKGRLLGKAEILVRVGIHYGSVVHRENDIFGRNVALAARVAALADGGQILVSEPVAEALADCEDLTLEGRTSVELKGLPGEHVVTTIGWRG